MRRGAGLLLAVLGVTALCMPSEARAQYFGRNQVQYESFNFRILRTDHFDVYFYPSEAASAPMAARIAERWYARLSKVMGDSLHGRQPLVIYASQAQFEQNNIAQVGEGVGGVTESFKRRIVLPFGASLEETDHVIGHELVHAFQYDITSGGRLQAPGAVNLPLWFIEGMAEYLSIGPVDPQTSLWVRDAVQQNHVPKFKQLDDPRYFPYRWGQALWAYVGGRWGDEVIGQVLRSASRTRDPFLALRNVLGIEPDSLEAQWRAALNASYEPVIAARQRADSIGTALETKAHGGGEYNVGAALSPDGNSIVYLSSRGQFSIDLYLADANTGRVRRRLTSTAFDPHVESLMFIYSAGAWSDDGHTLVYAATVDGRPALEIEDADTGHRIREIKLPDLDEIYSPSWSPDGQKIVFSAHTAGVTDLFAYDLQSNQRDRLTNDPYSDLQPVYSPDGRSIAFVTDRFTTDLTHLAFGDMRLAVLDVASGRITQLPGFRQGKQINPQWSQDGRSVFFLADPDGVPNVYRAELGSDSSGARLFRLTNAVSGATGITDNSPALSVAAHADRAVVSIFKDRTYEIHRLESGDLAGTPVTDSVDSRVAETLPPRTTSPAPSVVLAYRADAVTGLPPEDSFPVHPYVPTFGLDYVAQPYLSAGVSSFGTYVGGGVQMFWSSMLGDRQMATLFQINGGVRDIAAEVDYVNLSHRLDWGITASQIPYLSASFGYTTDRNGQINGTQELLFRQTSRQIEGMVQYPFNQVQRVEFSAGAMMLSYDVELRQQFYDANGNLVSFDSLAPGCPSGQVTSTNGLCAPNSIYLGQATGALVYDNALFGGTGPILGTRYRFEADPSFGTINFVGALADVRKYIMPIHPLTLAFRAMHFGRYGSGATDQRLFPIYVGYQTLIRGYDFNSIFNNECSGASSLGSCTLSSRLFGTRILVGNAEARLPILGAPFGLLVRGAAPPVDLVAFSDWGQVYGGDSLVSSLQTGTKPGALGWMAPIWSYGAGLRVNLFGFLIGEVDYVNPVARPRGWYFQLGFSPGF